jgi:hypothetical protein
MRSRLGFATAIAAGLLISCSDDAREGPGDQRGACDARDYVPTPSGWLFHKSCVRQVPNGALVRANDAGGVDVYVDGGLVAQYPACACPRMGSGPPTFPRPSDAGPPDDNFER